ncbi:hypothetical protein M2132_001720 [Dysgonomonas sp. PH5-45]|uniref:DUF5683 domain-containing protein n=1 Tax=unclassified Dysgonomonas TaxID=2630389 RepID=UPI002476BAC1|nr:MULTISPECIES: DUF5683 domain-containing protein [unclassified Dysgonomonas]MDH6355379.1 hypothetical protein [Dysgonomonas sp. PH5-45]MDH6388277.1 hypothetical protein [Dysgonomonas sp. PH5-37]
MKLTSAITLFIILLMGCLPLNAQDSLNIVKSAEVIAPDTNSVIQAVPMVIDSAEFYRATLPADSIAFTRTEVKIFRPDPKKAVLYSAICPGLGQIYNRRYWKLPIVYGGFIGLAYAISWNGRYYNDYTDAYKAIMSDDPRSPENSSKWLVFLSSNTSLDDLTDAQIVSYQGAFKRKRDYFRRYRDLSIIGTVALYAVCMIDAYVDAQLFDFNISEDLSFRIEPAVLKTVESRYGAVGFQCSINF